MMLAHHNPAMPAMSRSLHADPGMVELTISGYLIGFSLGQLLWGPISDRYGRRPSVAVAHRRHDPRCRLDAAISARASQGGRVGYVTDFTYITLSIQSADTEWRVPTSAFFPFVYFSTTGSSESRRLIAAEYRGMFILTGAEK